MNKKILLPINFSTTAQNAFHFAQALAMRLDKQLDILHVYDGLFDNNALFVQAESLGNQKQYLRKRMP